MAEAHGNRTHRPQLSLRPTGFEDQTHHQTGSTSTKIIPSRKSGAFVSLGDRKTPWIILSVPKMTKNRITQAFENRVIFVTGATGFLGQPLVEKILYAAPGVKRMYLLIRPKRKMGGKTMSADERLQKELYQSSVFNRLHYTYGQEVGEFLREKLVAVEGDISRDDFGLALDLQERLKEEIDILINSAAVVSFDAPLNDALEFNVLSARRAAQFARSCKGALLVHVSTAYVSGTRQGSIPETIHHPTPSESLEQYPRGEFNDVGVEIEHLQAIIQGVKREAETPEMDREFKEALLKRFRRSRRGEKKTRRREKIENIRRKWIKNRLTREGMIWARQRGWNDTYTYTKALGEQVVLRNRGDTPTVIMRPSVIEGSLTEPNPGWLDGLRMADPLIVAIGKGRLRTLPMDAGVTLDLIPVDMVVNALLASVPRALEEGGVSVYQVATGARNPITLGELHKLIYEYFRKNPMLDREGHPILVKPLKFPKPATFRIQHKLKTTPLGTIERALERLPASVTPEGTRRKIAAAKAAYERLYYYGEIYQPYLNLNCSFEVDNTLNLYNSLSDEEKKAFNFDMTQLNWRHYIQNVHIPGVKKHVLKKEGVGTLEVAETAPGTPLTIDGLLARAAEKLPTKTALQIKRDGHWHRFAYAQLKKLSEKIGDKLLRMGLRKGDRVILYSQNQPEWGAAFLGASSVGVVVVPLDSQTWHKEVWALARFTEARALLLSEYCFGKLPREGLTTNEKSEKPIYLLNINDECKGFEQAEYPCSTSAPCNPEAPVQREEVGPDDLASIIFTTGTKVDPKGVMHTHRNFISNLLGVNHYLAIAETDQLLSVLPLYHALEFTCGLLMAIYGGATVTYVHSLKPKIILETMRDTGTTCMLGVPTLYALIRDDVERRIFRTSKSPLKSNLLTTSKQLSRSVERTFGKNIGRKLFSRVHQEFGGRIRVFVSGGSALGAEVYDDFRVLGMPIYEGYGLTETAPVLTVNPLNRSRKGSAGKPVPGVELRIFNPDKEGVGEIIVQTPSLMKGYYKNPRATAEAIRDGWLHTGDLGWVDADGYIYLTGRIKDVIVTGAGKNVYPADLEAIYRSLPSVREICVIGIRSGLTEEIHAVIVPDAAVSGEGPLEPAKKAVQREIQGLARELPSYQRLQQIHIWREPLPRTESIEICRATVRQRLLEQLEAERGRIRQQAPAAEEKGGSPERELLQELSRLSGIPAPEIAAGTHLFSDLGLDSLMMIELLLFVEQRFGLSVADRTAGELETVGQLMEVFRGQLSDAPKAAGETRPPKPKIRSIRPLSERSAANRYLQALSCSALKSIYRTYFSLELHNCEYLPKTGPCLIATNHASHLDTGAVISALSSALGTREAQKLHVIGAKDYFFDTPLKSWFFSTFLNVFPVEREEASLSGIRMVKSILSTGERVLIFPEGTRSRTGQIREFKPGLGLIALEMNVPIVPAYICGTYDAMPAGKVFPRPRPIKVTFGPPIEMDRYRANGPPVRDELYRRIAADVRQAIVGLSNGRSSRSPEP